MIGVPVERPKVPSETEISVKETPAVGVNGSNVFSVSIAVILVSACPVILYAKNILFNL